jgi:hypothetical protein
MTDPQNGPVGAHNRLIAQVTITLFADGRLEFTPLAGTAAVHLAMCQSVATALVPAVVQQEIESQAARIVVAKRVPPPTGG